MLESAAEQFGGKTEIEIKEICLVSYSTVGIPNIILTEKYQKENFCQLPSCIKEFFFP